MSKVISQSEVDSFLSCKRRHYYAHMEKIKPKTYSKALNRGTIGHDVLAQYYLSLKELRSVDQAKEDAMQVLNKYAQAENMEVLLELTVILNRFFSWAAATQMHWEILEVEQEHRIPVPGTDLIYPFKADLLVRDTKRDKVILVDHKFIQDFYKDDLIAILPQMGKYVGALQMAGIQVDDGAYQMLRTRSVKSTDINDHLRLQYMNLKQVKIDRYLKEQFSGMKQISAASKIDQETYRENFALRSANQFNCRSCPYLDLCTLDLQEGNRDLHIRSFYEPNDYGYE